MSHACSAFAVALFIWTWWQARRRWTMPARPAWGSTAGLMAMVREQDLFFVVGPGPGSHAQPVPPRARWRVPARRPRSLRAAIVAGVALLPHPAAAVRRVPGTERVPTALAAGAAQDVVERAARAGGAGVAEPRPAGVDAARRARAGRPRLAVAVERASTPEPRRRTVGASRCARCRCSPCRSTSQAASSPGRSRGRSANAGSSPRRCCSSWDWPRCSRTCGRALARTTLAVVTVLAVWWNLGLIVQFGAGLMDRQRIEPARNAYTSFVVLPRTLPTLVWRYVFDRDSFYKALNRAACPARRRADGTVMRLLYFADTRFPLERANGIQTFETCHALARAGHEVTLVVRADTQEPPARSLRVLRRLTARRAADRQARAARAGAVASRRVSSPWPSTLASRRDVDVVFTRDLGVASALLHLPRSAAPTAHLRVARVVGDRRRADSAIPVHRPGRVGSKQRRLARREQPSGERPRPT